MAISQTGEADRCALLNWLTEQDAGKALMAEVRKRIQDNEDVLTIAAVHLEATAMLPLIKEQLRSGPDTWGKASISIGTFMAKVETLKKDKDYKGKAGVLVQELEVVLGMSGVHYYMDVIEHLLDCKTKQVMLRKFIKCSSIGQFEMYYGPSPPREVET